MSCFKIIGRLAILGIAVIYSWPCSAQPWPQRTVKVILPNPPGVALDVIVRIFSERLSAKWGQPVIVENLPGADGITGAREFVIRRDDHTLLYSFPGLITINPIMHDKLPYKPNEDFVPIASTSENYLAIAAGEALKVDSLQELFKPAHERDMKLNWAATPGLPYFALAGLLHKAGVNAVHVPYRDFNQALADLGEGRIDLAASGVAPLLPHVQSKKVKLLAFFNRERASVAPDVPTTAELGHSEFSLRPVTGFFGWKGMPVELRDRIASDIRAIANEPSVIDRLNKMGVAAHGVSPIEFAELINGESAVIAAIAKTISPMPQ